MSQEWREVVNKVKLMIERLNACRDELFAAADGGKLAEEQSEFARDSTAIIAWCSLHLLDLHVEATSGETDG